MRRAGVKIISLCCAILMLPIFTCACRKKKSKGPDDSAVAEKQVRTLLDDYFAYIKIAKIDNIDSLCEDASYSKEYIHDVTKKVGTKVFEATCRRVSAEVLSVTSSGDEAVAKVKLTFCDPENVIEMAGPNGFEDNIRLANYIDTAPSASKELSLVLRYKDGAWKIVTKSVGDIFKTVFGFLETDGLIAEPELPDTIAPAKSMSVYDAYWVDSNGDETSGYHCSEDQVCLYVYTWNTYSNTEITYEYFDNSWNSVYTNTFLMKSNTDWIACAWRPEQPLPEGYLYCRLYEPNGMEFLTTITYVYPDGEILPYAITFMEDSSWVDSQGLPVKEYPADTPVLEFHARALKSHKDLDLVYRFLDEDGNVLYESTLKVDQLTDTFIFTWNREGLEPLFQEPSESETSATKTTTGTSEPTETTEPPKPKMITLDVYTSEGQLFIIDSVQILSPDAEAESSVSEPQETQS